MLKLYICSHYLDVWYSADIVLLAFTHAVGFLRMMRIDIITMLIRSKAYVLIRFLGDFVLSIVKGEKLSGISWL